MRVREEPHGRREGLGRRRDVLTFELPASGSAPGMARACLSAAASGLTSDEEVAEALLLLTTELVSNAIRHSGIRPGEDIILRVDREESIRVEVLDPGPGFTPKRPRSPSGPNQGWGLRLTEALAKAWGVEREGARTKVWFELEPSLGPSAR
jgi:anti-sigma regulatory factor (Ser/Thr protein kinase)